MDNRPTIYWILQENHITDNILHFLKFFTPRLSNINLQFFIPSTWKNTVKQASELNPTPFDGVIHGFESYEWYDRKRNSIKDLKFKDGLEAWRVLVLDDVGGGRATPVIPKLPENPNLQFIILQPPTPLGSTENEERFFYACVHWAHQRKIPAIGYELLPFDTKWTLIPALLDGVITHNQKSFDWLTSKGANVKTKIWQLPRYQAQMFSSLSSVFWRNALPLTNYYGQKNKISPSSMVLYIPHNVAMTYEYKRLIQALANTGKDIHLMISIGKDQGRGTHTHQEIVETLNKEDLKKISSHSFHDLNHAIDMSAADAVVAHASCYATFLAEDHHIPTLIVDPDVAPQTHGNTQIVSTYSELIDGLTTIEESIKKTTPLETIFGQIITELQRMKTTQAEPI